MPDLPDDVLERLLEKKVEVVLKDGSAYSGVLKGYDEHVNITLLEGGKGPSKERLLVIRGQSVLHVESVE